MILLVIIMENPYISGVISPTHVWWILRNSILEFWYPWEMVTIDEGIHKMGEEEICEAKEVG